MLTPAVDEKTRPAFLIGHPVGHSISPAIHNHAFASLALPCHYELMDVAEAQALPGVLADLRARNFIGANVTIPYKSAVLPLCDEISDLSRLTGTVNTLYMQDGKLCGTTTDYLGFKRALEADGFNFKAQQVLVLGNGGTARTLAIALASDADIGSLMIACRREEAARALADDVVRSTSFPCTSSLVGSDACASFLQSCTLVVNCTSAGMHPQSDITPIDTSLIPPSCYVFDAIYNPAETKLLREARLRGCRTQNGLRMLLMQGLASFAYWTGIQPSPDLFDMDALRSLIG